jgi:hypothetical protein
MNGARYTAAMLRAFEQTDRAAIFVVATAHKNKARNILREQPVIATPYAAHIYDRWLRRYARHHPMGKFIHGATFEEPKRRGPIIRTIPIRRG